MDESNILELENMASQLQPQPQCKIQLLGSYIGRMEDMIIKDPYFVNSIYNKYYIFKYFQLIFICRVKEWAVSTPLTCKFRRAVNASCSNMGINPETY